MPPLQKPGHYRNQCRQLKREKDQAQNNTKSAGSNNNNSTGGQLISNSNNKISNITNANNTNNQKTENLDLSTHPMRPVVKLTLPQRNVILEQTQLIDRLPGTDGRMDRIRSNKEMPKTIEMGMFKLQPKP